MQASVPPFQGVCGMGAELEVVVSLDAERPSHCPHRWLGPWPLAVPTRASPQCLTRTHAPQSGCMAVLGYRCTAFNWGAISRPQASYTGLHPTDARSKSEYSLTHSLTHSLLLLLPPLCRLATFHSVLHVAFGFRFIGVSTDTNSHTRPPQPLCAAACTCL